MVAKADLPTPPLPPSVNTMRLVGFAFGAEISTTAAAILFISFWFITNPVRLEVPALLLFFDYGLISERPNNSDCSARSSADSLLPESDAWPSVQPANVIGSRSMSDCAYAAEAEA